MSKVGFFIVGLLCGVLLPSLYAWKQVDKANMAKPEVKVIREYEGQFRGWESEHLPNRDRGQSSPYRAGYCECNCQQKKKHT